MLYINSYAPVAVVKSGQVIYEKKTNQIITDSDVSEMDQSTFFDRIQGLQACGDEMYCSQIVWVEFKTTDINCNRP